MAQNRGKQFEEVIKEAFLTVPNTSVVRLPDPVQGYLGYRNICDFIIYHYPNQLFIECKSVHGGTLPFSNITDNQWQGLLEMSKIDGVIAGVICWWIDKDVTAFIPISVLRDLKELGHKSVSYQWDKYAIEDNGNCVRIREIHGKKKRVFFDYDMEGFLNEF